MRFACLRNRDFGDAELRDRDRELGPGGRLLQTGTRLRGLE